MKRSKLLTIPRAATRMLLATLLLTMTAQTAWAEWVTYIDENGTKKEEGNATELNGGGATTLQAGLYVVKHDITYTGTVTLSGNVKIVLNDGCTMNIGTSESRLSGKGFYYNSNESLTIYGQTNGTGALSVYTTGEYNYAIWAGAITINGGHVTADTNGQNGHAIYAEAITINGGHVTAHTAGNYACAIYSRISAFTYNGGIVSASTEDASSFDYRYNAPAIASDNYTFNWRSATDRITIGTTGLLFDPNDPLGYTTTATFSKPFSDGTTTYSGTLTDTELNALANKTLQPAYTITYDLAGGIVATANPTTYTIGSADITLNNPTKDGYTFAGWTGTDLGAATTSVTIAHGSTGDRSYTATWRKLLTNTDITVTIPTQEWTGSELTPTITLKDGETALTETTDYTVTLPSGRTNSGDYTVTLTGTGNYDGTTTKTFTITPKAVGTYGALAVTEDQNGKTATIDASLEATIEITSDIKVSQVALQRSFTENQPATVMLPFSLGTGQTVNGGSFYKFSGVTKDGDEWKALFTEVATLKANTPYLFNPSATGQMTFDLDGSTVTLNTTTTGETGSTASNWEFRGTYQRVQWNGTVSDPSDLSKTYGFAKGNATIAAGQFVHFAAGAWLKPMRCYLVYNGSTEGGTFQNARSMTRGAASTEELPQTITVVLLSSSGETTGIGTLDTKTGDITLDGWYTMDGRKLEGKPTKKGLYINNGRKIVIKDSRSAFKKCND